jgi:Histidinol phosphatase and related hydrolases of the PHP family
MKKLLLLFLAATLSLSASAQVKGRIDIPNLEGYVTLKCDFHMHSVFSDGLVWPTVRIDEAYREGLDAIALTDHIEYRPYRNDVVITSHNRSYEIARVHAQAKGIMLIRGSEITRSMPPGHHNAIFISDADPLDKPDYMDAFRAAKAQNAFIFWNHPGWGPQQPDTTLWMAEHSMLLQNGMMHGIEVVNGKEYYPEAHQWCLDKKLTMLGNSDSHEPMQSEYDFSAGKHRPMTLVFAKDATSEGIREALNERRTAVYQNENVIGEEKYLNELFEKAVEWTIEKRETSVRITVKNHSDLVFHLKKTAHDTRLVYFREYTIAPKAEQVFTVRLQEGIKGGDLNFCVENFLVLPNKGMDYTVSL